MLEIIGARYLAKDFGSSFYVWVSQIGVILIALALGYVVGGALADRLTAPLTVAIGGLASVMGAWWFSKQLPKIRVEARQLIIAQQMAGGEPPEEMTAPVAE